MSKKTATEQPNILFVMTDQQRFDTISALGNSDIYTPNIDRLVERGATFTNAYSSCPLCVPARYTIRTGCEPTTTDVWTNGLPADGHYGVEARCGPYLASAMRNLGYRTFGVGKFHTYPWDAAEGFDIQLHSEELYDSAEERLRDPYVAWLLQNHPEYSWIESLMGERTEMYYMPQMSPLPAALTVEAWTADRAVELIHERDERPWFGFVSFVGPHPPFAPPQPFNRMYDPDRMSDPIRGDIQIDHMDQYIPFMNQVVWAEDINNCHARVLKARYYGEISYIDKCIGRILDAVYSRSDASNTVICFFSDHGENLGDHHAWQKETFFESSNRVPFLVSWPECIPVGIHADLVCLTDLFGIATTAAGQPELREGSDVLGLLTRGEPIRDTLYGYHGRPGTWQFKLMVRRGKWKLIFLANGGMVQLFDLESDPWEINEVSRAYPDVTSSLLRAGKMQLSKVGCYDALDDHGMRELPYRTWKQQLEKEPWRELLPSGRIYQFDVSSGARNFPSHPSDAFNQ